VKVSREALFLRLLPGLWGIVDFPDVLWEKSSEFEWIFRNFCASSCRFYISTDSKCNNDWQFLVRGKYFSTDAISAFDEKRSVFREKTVFCG
jgi:hypothetical protein